MAMRKTALTMALACMAATSATAQYFANTSWQPLKHLDVSITTGTTGIGVDVATPVAKDVFVRTGLEYMPRVEINMPFGIQSFDESGLTQSDVTDEDGEVQETMFDRMAATLESFTGYRADPTVVMVGKPNFWNFKLLVDVYPFKNKHWHLTAGFHWGSSKIGTAVNSIDDAPSLVAVNMYNNLYTKVLNSQPVISDIVITGERRDQILANGRMGIHVGDLKGQYVMQTVLATDENGYLMYDDNGDPIVTEEYALDADGNKIPLPYRMEPDADCKVSAKVTVNSFKPYLGFGYGGKLLKNDDRYHVSFDAGLMFWGGTPNVITHDGTNLSKDVENIGGKVGRYVDIISGVKAFPVVNLRITRRIF